MGRRIERGAWGWGAAALLGLWAAAGFTAAGQTAGPLGGEATVQDASRNAFGHPVPGLTADQQAAFFVGNSFFKRNWIQAPASAGARDGLGPLFNARACAACHVLDGRAQPPVGRDSADHPFPGLVMRLSVPGETPRGVPAPEPSYGVQFSTQAIAGVPAEGALHVDYREQHGTYPDGTPYVLRQPRHTLRALAHGPLAAGAMASPRLAPQLVGLGLLEAVDEADLQAIAQQQVADGDGVRGRLNRVWDPSLARPVAGRFGWKAGTGSVAHQTAAAFRDDMGITSTLLPEESCMPAQEECLRASRQAPDIDGASLDKVVQYVRLLAVPAQRDANVPAVRRGEALFRAVRCAACHVESMKTGAVAAFPRLSGQAIRPYTDLLLHDMGPGLTDGRPDHLAGERDWRTPPLWGIGLLERVNGQAFYLHDGRARSLEEAILWHGGEAAAAQRRFMNLSARDRAALLQFLRSL